jgi:hypothetical protein
LFFISVVASFLGSIFSAFLQLTYYQITFY